MVRAVFFDAAGTLFHLRSSVGQAYARQAARFGVNADPAEIDARFREAFRAAPPMAFPGATAADIESCERRWWADVVRRAFAAYQFDDFPAFFAALFSHFARPEAWALYGDVVPTLAALRRRVAVIGVISNFDGRLEGLLHGLGLAPFLDSVTLSSRVGAAKPDPRIFLHALRRHGLRPGEALHAGDSAEEDVAGALAAGMQALQVRGRHGPGLAAVLPLIAAQ